MFFSCLWGSEIYIFSLIFILKFEIITLDYPLFGAVFIIVFISFCVLCDDTAIGCNQHATVNL